MKKTLTIRSGAEAPSSGPNPEAWTPSPERLERLKERARTLRREQTPAEAALWERLSGARLGGIKFTRKAVVGSVIVDFACPSRWVVISLSRAEAKPEIDELQDRKLAEAGIRVLRFSEAEVLDELDRVTGEIATLVNTPFERPGARRGGGDRAPARSGPRPADRPSPRSAPRRAHSPSRYQG